MQKNNHLSGLNLSLSKTNRNLLEVESATVHLHANRSTLIVYIPKFTRPKSIEIKIVSSRQRSQLIGPTIFFISEKRRIDALIGYIIIFTSEQTVSLARRSSWVTIIAHFYELRRIFTGASQRLEPVINVGCKMLSVPFVFSMSRFRGPAFRFFFLWQNRCHSNFGQMHCWLIWTHVRHFEDFEKSTRQWRVFNV